MRDQPIRAIVLTTLAALLLSACVPAPVRPEAPATRVDQSLHDDDGVAALLRYYRSLDGLADDALAQERRRNLAALLDGRCDAPRLQLAMALAKAPPRDQRADQVEALLQPCLTAPELAGTSVQTLALMLQSQLSTTMLMQQRYQNTARELETSRNENAELRRQLDGIKAIERSLQDRDRNRRHTEGTHGTAR